MIICPNCNKQLEDGTRFCDACGTQIIETIFCPNCGKQTSTEFAFCQNCSASLSDEAIVTDKGKKKKFVFPKPHFNISKKLIAIGSACIALVLVATIVLTTLFSNSGDSKNYALYLKDGEMYLTKISKIEPWQITTRLIDGDRSDHSDSSAAYICNSYTHLSNDGKILFYGDKISEDSIGATLFYRYVNKPKQEPVKIDSEISNYSVSESGELVTYLKGGEEGALYQHDLTEKEKIDSEVSYFYVSDDGKKIIYISREGDIYCKYAGKDKEKLDSEASYITYASEDCSSVYYVKDGSLYKKIEGKDKEKIASDVSSVLQVYESGEIYYLKSDSSEVALFDYVEDDLKESDAAMTEPQQPESPSYWDYDNDDDYQAARERYETAYEAYQIAKEAWFDKQERDELREDLAEKTMTKPSYTLCYYNGSEEKVLTDAFVDGSRTVSDNNPIIIYSVYNQSSVKKVKLSEIDYVSDIEDMVDAALYSSSEKYIAVKDNSSVIEQTEATRFIISSDGKTVYFLDDVSKESDHGDVYKMTISGNKAQKPELYDSDVYSYFVTFANNSKFAYYKDVKHSKGELYIDKQKIDDDVYLYGLIYHDESDTMVYMTDWNDEKGYGTLKMFNNGKAVKISDDVHGYITTPNGEILYLYDYSTNYKKGELFVYKNKKAEKIDDDVSYLISIYPSKYKGGAYDYDG